GATLSSGLPGGPDDLVADAIDNLGFGTDDTVAAEDLAFLNLARARELCKRVIKNTGPMLPLCLPFAVAARRQYGPGWDDRIAGLARQAEAAASLLRALPRRLHRLVRADGTPVRYSSRQLNTFQATYSSWAEQHPDLALLLLCNTDDKQASHAARPQ
ncbi:MAG: hypothetical protein ACLPQY_22555, partial [Streptosporangiaceae bacterium]